MKRLILIAIGMQLFLSALLYAQDIIVVAPPTEKVTISTEKIKNVVEQNSQKLRLANNIVKVYYTRSEEEFIIAKLSRFTYSVSFILIKTDGDSLTILDSNFIPKENDFELYINSYGLSKLLSETTDFLFDTECEDISSAVNAINTVSSYATNQNYSVEKLIGSSASISAIQSGITNNDLIGMGNVGHGSPYGIQLDNGFLSHTWFGAQDLSNEIFYFNSCEVFNQPFVSSMLDSGSARTFIGGVYLLPIGTSEEVFKDFWNYTLNQGWEMDDALIQGEINNGLENYNGIGGDEGIMNLTTSGTLRGNEIWSRSITLEGNITVPSGVKLTIKSGTSINFNGYYILSTGGHLMFESPLASSTTFSGTYYFDGSLSVGNGVTLTIAPNSNIFFNSGTSLIINGTINADGSNGQISFNSTGSSKWGGIRLESTASPNSVIKYCNINNANQGIYVGLGFYWPSNFPTIEYNIIENCNDGIYLYDAMGSETKPLRYNNIYSCINGIRIEGISSIGEQKYTWITDNNLNLNENGLVVRYSHPRIFRNTITCNTDFGIKIENYSAPKLAYTIFGGSGYNRISDNSNVNLYTNNHINIWAGQHNEVNEGRYGGYNTFGSTSDAQNPWVPYFIRSFNYSTVMVNYCYFGSSPPVSWKVYRDETSSIDYSMYLSWDPAPGSSCDQFASMPLSSNFYISEEKSLRINVSTSQMENRISSFATKGIKRNITSVLLYFGMHHILEGNLDSAALVFDNLINTYPDSLEAVFALDLLLRILVEQNSDSLFTYLTNLENNFGENEERNSFNLYKTSLPVLAGLHFANKDYTSALAVYDKILNEFSNSEDAKYALYNKFLYFINNENNYYKAKEIYNQLADNYSEDQILVDALILLGEDPNYILNNIKLNIDKLAKEDLEQIQKSDVDDLIVREFRLEQNYPNPFNPSTTFQYQTPIDGTVKLSVYDVLGREVTEIVNTYQSKGIYRVIFNFQDNKLSSGVYYYRINFNGTDGKNFRDVKKMVILK